MMATLKYLGENILISFFITFPAHRFRLSVFLEDMNQAIIEQLSFKEIVFIIIEDGLIGPFFGLIFLTIFKKTFLWKVLKKCLHKNIINPLNNWLYKRMKK